MELVYRVLSSTRRETRNKLRLSWAKLKISLVGVGDKVKVDVIVEVTTCPDGVGGRNDNNAKSALTKVEVKV